MFTHIKEAGRSKTGLFYLKIEKTDDQWIYRSSVFWGKIRGILNNSCKVENESHSTAGKTADESRTADRAESLFEVQITESR